MASRPRSSRPRLKPKPPPDPDGRHQDLAIALVLHVLRSVHWHTLTPGVCGKVRFGPPADYKLGQAQAPEIAWGVTREGQRRRIYILRFLCTAHQIFPKSPCRPAPLANRAAPAAPSNSTTPMPLTHSCSSA